MRQYRAHPSTSRHVTSSDHLVKPFMEAQDEGIDADSVDRSIKGRSRRPLFRVSVVGRDHGGVKPSIRRCNRRSADTGQPYLNEESLMTRGTLILGFVCLCCLLQTGNAALNDRTQKLLETQATNRPSRSAAATNAQKDVNDRPSYGPTRGVFSPPSTNPAGAANILPSKK
jgi:hypothetical protein